MIHSEGDGGPEGLYKDCAYSDTFVMVKVFRAKRDRKKVLHCPLQVRTIRFSQEHAPV